MSSTYHILNEPLPLNQDFRALKQKGLRYIQQSSGSEWNNLNPSDPGVTILDQLCYALTELGYCNDFPVADLLTSEEKGLQIDDQFYLPEEILTTSPVTVEDYRKYIIDGQKGILNALLVADACSRNTYQAYLLTDPALSAEEREVLCQTTFFRLNRSRSLGELFAIPLLLQPRNYFLSGRMDLEKGADVSTVLALVEQAIKDHIFPPVLPKGYDQLVAEGSEINGIMSGPRLSGGWILDETLGDKRNNLRSTELQSLLESLPGILSVSELSFFSEAEQSLLNVISSDAHELLSILVQASAEQNRLQIFCNERKVVFNANLLRQATIAKGSQQPIAPMVYGAALNTHADLPEGKFRNIEEYYSIQNTFPEIFGVGNNSVVSNASQLQIAQSRQLKGYLTLLDQLLANQFSQLANVGRLFSFRNAGSGTPSARKEYYETKTASEKKRREYPAPYRVFSPTYFYQPLYDVPHIRPLLKNNEMFRFGLGVASEKDLERINWEAYKLNPYNSYIRGLMEFMEDEADGLSRRNDLLDHLLARHGESPQWLDAVIDGSAYSGDSSKDRVIFKSLYLQNLGLLTYYRHKAYDAACAVAISAKLPEISASFEQLLLTGNSTDFIFDSAKISRQEELTEKEFASYSALELKLCLLFGLKTCYQSYISAQSENEQSARLALWMISERRGLILIENNLLRETLQSDNYPASETYDLELILPGFMPQLITPEFSYRLDLFLQSTVPAHLSYRYHFVSEADLEKLIPVFTGWHNTLLHHRKREAASGVSVAQKNSAAELVSILNQLYTR